MDVLGREPGDGARPRTNWRYWQGAAYDYGSHGRLGVKVCNHEC
jgi:hypothetical protein